MNKTSMKPKDELQSFIFCTTMLLYFLIFFTPLYFPVRFTFMQVLQISKKNIYKRKKWEKSAKEFFIAVLLPFL